MRLELAGKFPVDPYRVEQLSAVGKRVRQRALDGVGSDEYLCNFVLREQLFELAVRDRLYRSVLEP